MAQHDLLDYRGRWLLIDFMKTDCPHCMALSKVMEEIHARFGCAVLLKGGHSPGDYAVDLLFARRKITEFSAPFVRDVDTHGTGCAYSAAIAAGLASGLSLEEAICRAKTFVTASIAQRFRWRLRTGKNLDALNHSAQAANA